MFCFLAQTNTALHNVSYRWVFHYEDSSRDLEGFKLMNRNNQMRIYFYKHRENKTKTLFLKRKDITSLNIDVSVHRLITGVFMEEIFLSLCLPIV